MFRILWKKKISQEWFGLENSCFVTLWVFTPKLTKCQFQRLIFYTWENDLVQHSTTNNFASLLCALYAHFAARRQFETFVGLDDAMIRLPVMPNCPMKYSIIIIAKKVSISMHWFLMNLQKKSHSTLRAKRVAKR